MATPSSARFSIGVVNPLTRVVMGKGVRDAYNGFTAYTTEHIFFHSGEPPTKKPDSSSEGAGEGAGESAGESAGEEEEAGLLMQAQGQVWVQTCGTEDVPIIGIGKKETVLNGGNNLMMMGQSGVSLVAGFAPESLEAVSSVGAESAVNTPPACKEYTEASGTIAAAFTHFDTSAALAITIMAIALSKLDQGVGFWKNAKGMFVPYKGNGTAALANLVGLGANVAGAIGNEVFPSTLSASAPGANVYGEAGLFISTPLSATIMGGPGLLQAGLVVENSALVTNTIWGSLDCSIQAGKAVEIEGSAVNFVAGKSVTVSSRTNANEYLAGKITVGNIEKTWASTPTSHIEVHAETKIAIGHEIKPKEVKLEATDSIQFGATSINLKSNDTVVSMAVKDWALKVNKQEGISFDRLSGKPYVRLQDNSASIQVQGAQMIIRRGTPKATVGGQSVEVKPSQKCAFLKGKAVNFK